MFFCWWWQWCCVWCSFAATSFFRLLGQVTHYKNGFSLLLFLHPLIQPVWENLDPVSPFYPLVFLMLTSTSTLAIISPCVLVSLLTVQFTICITCNRSGKGRKWNNKDHKKRKFLFLSISMHRYHYRNAHQNREKHEGTLTTFSYFCFWVSFWI